MSFARRAAPLAALLFALGAPAAAQLPTLEEHLEQTLSRRERLLATVLEDLDQFTIRVIAYDSKDRRTGPVARVLLTRTGADSFTLRIDSKWITATLERTADRTMLSLPERNVRFVGTGALDDERVSLAPTGFMMRLLGGLAPMVTAAARTLASKLDEPIDQWKLGNVDIRGREGLSARSLGDGDLALGLHRIGISGGDFVSFDFGGIELIREREYEERQVDRAELERMVLRGAQRALSLHFPEPFGVRRPKPRTVAHGEVRRVGSQDLLLLSGSPEEIGTAQGQLLGPQVRRTIDSTLYLVGLLETVRKGEWFPDVLRDAWKRLSPHIPQRHQREIAAIAAAVPGVTLEELQLGNVFPEYFHCSGFAVFGKATKDGTLYHGRVLDYMTEIGLQQAAVATVVAPSDGHAFFSAGYAGFVGVVSGMNDQQISLGEMGGRGRFLWDGVPMATLMRRALEECTTLDEVEALWRTSPRTCEYYYVFADGKSTRAVAVKATPDAIEFLQPGQAHPELGEGIADAVIISAGDRLQTLRQRVQQQHGQLDLAGAQALMARPVAMSSNLHSVLFVPRSGLIRVAQADNHRPAVDCDFEEYDLRALLGELAAVNKK